jgi:hypothetical protein
MPLLAAAMFTFALQALLGEWWRCGKQCWRDPLAYEDFG